jgi:hypothetical protein
MPIVIDPVECPTRAGMWAYVDSKAPEPIPTLTDLDAAPTVIVIVWTIRVDASSADTQPEMV